MISRKPYQILFLRFVFFAAMLFALIMASLPQPPEIPGHPSDKIQHIIAFVVLTILARAANPAAGQWKIFVGLVAFGLLIEAVQTIPALHRDASMLDWLADGIAVAVTLGALALGRKIVVRCARTASEP